MVFLNILNCNSYNGSLITDMSARVIFYGIEDSIFNIYLNARRNKDGEVAGASDFDHLLINGIKFEKSYGKAFYEALWYQFFDENENLVQSIKSYDDFNDNLAENTMNSTARVFKLIKNYGMNGLYSNIKGFVTELKERKKENKENNVIKDICNTPIDEFANMDILVKKVVNKNFGHISKADMLNMIDFEQFENDKEYLKKLFYIRYDEKEGDCSKAYIQNQIIALRTKYCDEKSNNDKEKVILE